MTWHFVWIAGYLLSAAVIPFILLSNKRPAATLAWIWATILFPYLGPFLYLVLGSERMHRRRFRNRVKERLRSPRHQQPLGRAGGAAAGEDYDAERNFVETLSAINAQPITTADSARLLVNGKAFYDALEAAIAGARRSIHFESFIFRRDASGDRFLRLLTEAARRGVQVRLLLDEMGCSHVPRRYFREFVRAGGKFSWFGNVHPLRNRWTFGLRNHRKLQVVDGEIAFVGGMNIGREYLGEVPRLGMWHDIQVAVTGAVVGALDNTFADDWYFATDEKIPTAAAEIPPRPGRLPVQVIEDGPDNPQDPLSLSVVGLIDHARRRLWFTTAYFVPLYSHLSALKLAAARGVDVRMLVSARSEHAYLVEVSRSYYEELLRYGVRIYEFTAGINHGKVMAIDDAWVTVGSANFDNRSMHLNFELNLAFNSPEFAGEVAQVLQGYFAASEEIRFGKFIRRSFWSRLKESACRPLGPVL